MIAILPPVSLLSRFFLSIYAVYLVATVFTFVELGNLRAREERARQATQLRELTILMI